MSVKFFGQYLVEKDYISSTDLNKALDDKSGPHLGRLAVARGFMAAGHAKRLSQMKGSAFAARAVEEGLLSTAQVQYLEFLQKSDAKRLGEILLKRKLIDPDVLEFAIDEFNRDQQSYCIRGQQIPPRYSGRADMVSVVSMIENLLYNHGVVPFQTQPPDLFSGRITRRELTVLIELSGDAIGSLVLTFDRTLAVVFAGQLFGPENLDSEAMLQDSVREVANLVAGAAAGALAALGHQMEFTPPEFVPVHTPLKMTTEAADWEIATPWGALSLLMD
jgi:CheY-specific phosphatase CheX